jgi:hypothetical protein
MTDRIAQDRVNVGCLWSLAIGWAVLSWVWSLLPSGYSHSALYDEIFVRAVFLGALYFTYDRWRFPSATLVVDAPPVPGHAFRGKVETPLKSEPSSGIRVQLRAVEDVRRYSSTVWNAVIDAHPIRGEHGIIVPVELTIPSELAQDPRPRIWDLTTKARVPFGLYRAKFVVPVRHEPT